MFRRLFTVLSILGSQVVAQVCFTQQQVQTSTSLFSYKGNVYDITNYEHPGGAENLSLTIGGALEDFVNLPQYSFHLTKGEFSADLTRLLVGQLCTTPPVITTVAPVITTVAPVITTTAPVITTVAPTTSKCTTVKKSPTQAFTSSANTNEIYLYYVIAGIFFITMLFN
jgi:hypothetical protein